MAKNLVNGTNIVIEESGDNINMNLSSAYNTNLQQEINDSFKENNIYSTDEIIIGTWMGKPLYRKVFTGNIASSIEHGLTNVSFVNSYGYMMSGGGAFVPLPSVRPTNAGYYIGYYVTNQYIIFDKAADANGVATIILEYTKTTD